MTSVAITQAQIDALTRALKEQKGVSAMEKEKVLQEFNTLPRDAQKQVVDFIAFLQTRYKPVEVKRDARRKDNITDESFIGVWKNRDDMRDSNAWVRYTRGTEWGNP